jgi:hypothetical protein
MNIKWIFFVNLFKILIWYFVRWKIIVYNWISIKRFASWSWIIVCTKGSYMFRCFKKWKNWMLWDKYLITNQIMLSNKIHNMKIYQHKRTCNKNINQFANFSIQNHQWNILKYYCLEMNKIVCQTMAKLVFKFIKSLLAWDYVKIYIFEQFLLDY